MRNIPISRLLLAWLTAFATLTSPAAVAQPKGGAVFTTGGQSYVGFYSTADKLISVEIDGLTYKGHYASHADDVGRPITGTSAGVWGRAFLFASSADVLQCALDSDFPTVRGQCKGSDGRSFQLTPEALKKNDASPKLSATK